MTTRTSPCVRNLYLPIFASLFTAIITQLFIAAPAQAICEYQGQTYETGDTVGPYVCMPDGSWQPQ
ncbi:hypothetical protein [Leptolyngbya sp. 7M]|uniref:hypothetical protein n=1 Tax=Leptolyngbya sp. 7M TaxID=2812896 RepID=UPI001B8BA3E6|nr:hypothetical protein [Leptolyngbya sp. 7M]QYO63123.1 hypothetical protein JVX88_24625 [Leptolyngbya sp. 7M]